MRRAVQFDGVTLDHGNIRPVGATNLGPTLHVDVAVPATAFFPVGTQFNIVQTQAGTVQSGTNGTVVVVVNDPTNPLYTFSAVPAAGTVAGEVSIVTTGIPLLVPVAPPAGSPPVVITPPTLPPIVVAPLPPAVVLPPVTPIAAPVVSITRPSGGSAAGTSFADTLKTLGIAEQMQPKAKIGKGGGEAMASVAKGEAEIGFVFYNEINEPGVDVVGPLPAQVSPPIRLVALISSHAKNPAGAKALADFLSSPEAAAVYKAHRIIPGS